MREEEVEKTMSGKRSREKEKKKEGEFIMRDEDGEEHR